MSAFLSCFPAFTGFTTPGSGISPAPSDGPVLPHSSPVPPRRGCSLPLQAAFGVKHTRFAPGSNTQLCEEPAQPTNEGRNAVFGFLELCHLLSTHLTRIFGKLMLEMPNPRRARSLCKGSWEVLGRGIAEPMGQPGDTPRCAERPQQHRELVTLGGTGPSPGAV